MCRAYLAVEVFMRSTGWQASPMQDVVSEKAFTWANGQTKL